MCRCVFLCTGVCYSSHGDQRCWIPGGCDLPDLVLGIKLRSSSGAEHALDS